MISGPVLVVGAGIGGLTTALALAQRGFAVAVFEQAERLEEIGAGIQLSPNASRILRAVERIAKKPREKPTEWGLSHVETALLH